MRPSSTGHSSTRHSSTSRWSRRGMLVTSALTAATLLASCGAGGRPSSEKKAATAEVGITKDSVTIGGHFPLTGVAAPGYSEIPTGAKAYFDYVNAAGGVNGRKITFIAKDDGYDPTKTSQVTNELLQQDKIFAMVGGLGTPTHAAVVKTLNSAKVPDLFVSSGGSEWGNDPKARPYTFGWQPAYEIEAKIIGQWVKQNMPHAKVGLFLQNDDLGAGGEKGVRKYIDKQVVSVQKYTPGNTDVAPQIAALKASGADLVLGFNVPAYTALSQLVALKLGYKPKWFYDSIGLDVDLVGGLLSSFSKGAVKDGTGLLEGVMSDTYIPTVDQTDNPWTQLWQKVWTANGSGGAKLTNYRIYGMSFAYTFAQALQAAGPNPTRDGIVKALEASGKKFAGPNLAPYQYSADNHLGISGAELVKVGGGKIAPLTKVLVTDAEDGQISPNTAAPATPPAKGIPDVKAGG